MDFSWKLLTQVRNDKPIPHYTVTDILCQPENCIHLGVTIYTEIHDLIIHRNLPIRTIIWNIYYSLSFNTIIGNIYYFFLSRPFSSPIIRVSPILLVLCQVTQIPLYLECNNTNVAEYDTSLSAYLKCASSVWICSYTLYYIYIYTRGTLRAWPMLTASIDLIGQSIVYVFDIYIIFSLELLQIYYCYITLLLM